MKPNRLGLAICGNFYLELQSVLKDVGIQNIDTLCIKPTCLDFDPGDKDRITHQLKEFKQNTDYIHILTPLSCTGYKTEDCQSKCFQYHCASFCSELFAPRTLLNQIVEEGYYVVTPGWITNWKAIVQQRWKFSEPFAKQFFHDTVKQVCVLDTGVYPDYRVHLEEFAQFAGLEYKTMHIGLDYFRLFIEKLIMVWHHENELKKEKNRVKDAAKKIADYTMALEIMKDLSNLSSERALVQNIFNLFTILFSPQKMSYIPVNNGQPGDIQNFIYSEILESDLLDKDNPIPYFESTQSKNGFRINACYEKEILGYIEVEDILFSEHLESYTALTNSISSVLGLLIFNSRQYGKVLKEKIEILERSEYNLMLKNAELQQLYMDLQSSEEEIRSSNEELRATADELMDLNKLLEAAKVKAEESDHLKTAFLHNMSHEIRTPLNAILGFSSMLTEYYNDFEKISHFAGIINKRGNDLLEIIDGILDIAKIESGQMPVHMDSCNLSALLNDLTAFFSEYKQQLNKPDLQFRVVNSSGDDLIILTDAVKLKQIFINLINNALKFTEKGRVEAGFSGVEENELRFYVSDTGIGIPHEKHSEIFNRFMQVDHDTSRLFGGTGLGLSIVQGLLRLLNGKIWLDSEPGKGSTFHFSVPYQPDLKGSLPLKLQKSQVSNFKSKAVILIVEDDFYNAQYLKEILLKLNCEVLHTTSGNEAVLIASRSDLDIVLMDIRLPDISGYEASLLIKHEKPDLVIIAQTAYATSSDQAKAMESGCDDYVSKPVKKDVLLGKISKILSKHNNVAGAF